MQMILYKKYALKNIQFLKGKLFISVLPATSTLPVDVAATQNQKKILHSFEGLIKMSVLVFATQHIPVFLKKQNNKRLLITTPPPPGGLYTKPTIVKVDAQKELREVSV